MSFTSCNDCLSSMQAMLNRERQSYDKQFSSTDGDYTVVRRSLIDVFDEVFDLCHLQNRDTVSVAVSYLDRFMACQKRVVNVQVAAMTCFYLAVKLYEPTVIPPAMLCELFQRVLECDDEEEVEDDSSAVTVASAESVESMEMTVLSALSWNLNPPTSMMFVRQLLCCLPNSTSLKQWKEAALNLSEACLRVGLRSDETTAYRASTQAVASLFIAVEALPPSHRAPVYKFLLQAVHMTSPQEQREVLTAQATLKRLVSEAVAEETVPVVHKRPAPAEESSFERPAKKQRSTSFTSSPRSILFPVNEVLA